jgi:hypothetical protein
MTLRLSEPKTKARFLLIGYGLILVIWMSLEDKRAVSVALLGTGAAIIYLGTWILSRFSGQDIALRFWFTGFILSGIGLGAASALSTAILMFFKSSWHEHLYPDYPPQMIAAMLARMPFWAMSGALFGLAIAICLLLSLSHLQPSQVSD